MEKDNGVAPFVHIIQRANGYAVYSNNLRPYGTFCTSSAAMDKARKLQDRFGGVIAIHRLDGMVISKLPPKKSSVYSVSDTERPFVVAKPRKKMTKPRRLKAINV